MRRAAARCQTFQQHLSLYLRRDLAACRARSYSLHHSRNRMRQGRMVEQPAYQVLARKYRPGHFRDLIGQDAMVRTLTNAFQHDRIAHAFILTGVRGVGKTTTARIIAKGLNCQRDDGPTIDPCGECEACRAIAAGRHVDVIEMDAASNTGVDYIREINEAVRYRPAEVRYKIFIIDEVHMLSTGAFNALLKTLEEPPSHAVFIMATTDPQKIPAMILSRVQRFDFKRISTQQICERLEHILIEEDLREGVSSDAIEYIGKLANGGMRDAISLLDTCLGYKTELQLEDISEILGITSYDAFFELMNGILAEQPEKVFETIEELHEQDNDLKQFIKEFMQFLVDLNKIKIVGNYNYVSIPSAYHDRVQKGMDYIIENNVDLSNWFKVISQLSNSIRYESNPKTLIEGELICL